MTDLELNFIAFIFIIGVLIFGMFMGYSMDDNNKDPITAFLDGYIIVLPMIMMIALLAPVFMAAYGVISVVYSMVAVIFTETTFKETLYSDVTGPGYLFFGYLCLFIFWSWFRRKILGYEDVL
ncbi:hypothetical protein [Belliella pelovolcani]|uniref:hypothetical protein n=1 Tax=Belliella pelovolcani TaxID=529505 RepID=UPI00391A4790